MLLKPRTTPRELLFLRTLSPRMMFTEEQMEDYINLEKGYEGELKFDALMDNQKREHLLIRDLFLTSNKSEFQLDNLLFTPKRIYQLEVKNFEGEHYIETEAWYTSTGKQIKNPLLQLKRSENLLNQLLYKMKANMKVDSYLIFINQEFTLYSASQSLPVNLPSQINRFLKKLFKDDNTQNFIYPRQKGIANQLIKLHKTETPYMQIPEYNYRKLKKGIVCSHCMGWMEVSIQGRVKCSHCSKEEFYLSAIERSVEEFKLLFPNEPLTVNRIFNWSGGCISRKTVQRYLTDRYKKNGKGRSIFYEKN